jgi:hypothetical protein
VSKCKTGENKGGVRTVTLREVSETHEWHRRHGEDTGRRRQSCDHKLVSVNQANQRGRGQTEGRPELRVTRQSLPRQQARRAANGGGRTGARTRRTAVELPGRARDARRVLMATSGKVREEEGERVLGS